MDYKAVFLGAIGTLVETSDLQRRAFNKAFVNAGVDWYWSPDIYQRLLRRSGGAARVAHFADALGETVDAKSIHADKVRIFADMIRAEGLSLRPGIRDLIDHAKAADKQVGFVTSTGKDQVDAIFQALGDDLSADEFDYVGHAGRAKSPKPAPDIYLDALRTLDLKPAQVLAIEDTPVSADAALAAGIATIAFPGAMADVNAFAPGVHVVEMLTPAVLTRPLMAAE